LVAKDRRPIGRQNILLNQRVRLVADHLVANLKFFPNCTIDRGPFGRDFFFLKFPWGTIGRGPFDCEYIFLTLPMGYVWSQFFCIFHGVRMVADRLVAIFVCFPGGYDWSRIIFLYFSVGTIGREIFLSFSVGTIGRDFFFLGGYDWSRIIFVFLGGYGLSRFF
jgi:hypothetical protein